MSRFHRGGGVALKPENALKRAEELIGVGQKQNALQTLHDTVTNKRHQRNWTKALEEVMYRYVDLAVEMKQARKLKDALINYRNACQQVNVGSLGDVLTYLVNVASEKAEEASKEAQAMIDELGDLEADDSPEEMILSYVSGERSSDRTDREVVTPWFKLLWETHRNILDVLRNNSRLEVLYATAASRAFTFCVQYKRTTEFRRLCDILRNHLGTLIKYKDQQGRDRTDLTVPATWELYIDVRFEQLKTACTLELWAEAFRSVEDIQGLVGSPPKGVKAPKASLMATYYARLTQIFTRSEARLYNAYAWYRLFTFSRSFNKSLTSNDVVAMASNVVLSALSVLPYDSGNTAARGDDVRPHGKENAAKMANILGFNVDRLDRRVLLSRQALLADIERKGLLQLVPPPVKAVFSVLEGDFNPLKLCQTLSPVLEELKALSNELDPTDACPVGPSAADLSVYVPYIQQVALSRTIRQLSDVYSVMRVSSLSDLAPFGWTFGQSEALILDAVRHGFLQARFDHRNGTVHFGGKELAADNVKSQISSAAKKLSKVLASINAHQESAAEMNARRAAAIQRAIDTAADENRRALARKQVIENRKEEHERLLLQKEMEEEARRQEAEAKAREDEERRKAAERVRREEERILREMAEEEQARVKAELAARGKKIDNTDNLDVAALKAEMLREEDKSAQDMRRRLNKLAKQMDHLERAKREEEAPLREEALKSKLKNEEGAWKHEQEMAMEAHRKAWEHDLAVKKQVQRMQAEAKSLADAIQSRRAAEFELLRAEKKRAAEARKEARKAERDIARKREYVRRCCMEIEKKRREEEEARVAEERERAAKEQAEHQRKLDEMAEKQRQREAEIEARAKADESAPAASAQSAPKSGRFVPPHLRRAAGGSAPPPSNSGSWRDRGRDDSRDNWSNSRAPPPSRGGGSRW
jgi:translation initiation factor 3 subunit A